jgi:hypothetical protein
VPPRRGRSLTSTQKVPQHHIDGLAGRCAGEGVGRPAVVPPAGRVRGMGTPLPGRWGREGGALSSKAPELGAVGSEIQPYRKRAGGGNGRLGDRSPTGNAPGSEDSAYRVAAQVAAVFREPLGMLRDWESGSRGDGDL